MSKNKNEFLLELFSEEIPADLQPWGANELQKLICKELGASGLEHGDSRVYYGPRRLALIIDDIADKSPDIKEQRKGPRVGAPEKALAGFLRGAGLDSIEQCETIADIKGEFYVAIIEKQGLLAEDILASTISNVLPKFPWPKSMRWGSGKLRWVRPLHSILALLNGKTIKLEVEGIHSGNRTAGHRFMAPKELTVKNAADYEKQLTKAFVQSSAPARQEAIMTASLELAANAGLELVVDEALVAETAGLVEWPQVLMGEFDEDFLFVPPEVLITSMKKHQKCFSLKDPKTGKLANRFLLVSNMLAADNGAAIIQGNERVIRARLSDASFFWEQDRKVKLEDMAKKLDHIIFHEKLGTQGRRVERIAATARTLAPFVDADPDQAERAALLCKADLVSEMVGEFANLQGLMGRYYAENQGELPEIAAVCEDHYRPQGPSDKPPTQPISIAVGLADKLVMLTSLWIANEKPTGSSDPYALRRAALGIIRTILDNEIRLSWSLPIQEAAQAAAEVASLTVYHKDYEKLENVSAELISDAEKEEVGDRVFLEHLFGQQKDAEFNIENYVRTDLLSFFADRLKVYLRDKGARHDLIDAVFALEGQDDLLMIVKRVEALGVFLETDDGTNLLAGIKRAANILRIEEKKDARTYQKSPKKALLSEPQEIDLFDAIATMEKATDQSLKNDDFAAAMSHLAKLRAPVDAFFDHVTVNDDDPALRVNRLALLAQIREATKKVADFSKIEG